MVSSPVQNLSGFLKNRPTLVVFLLCLVALAVSTFYFAFEIEKDGPTVNSDKEHDWIQMLKQFNKLDTCISSSKEANEIHTLVGKGHGVEEISVFTAVSVENANVLKSFSEVHGALSLDGWFSTTCQDPKKQPETMELSFNVPSLETVSNGSVEVCVTVKGPAQFLPYLKTPLCKPANQNKNSKVANDKGLLTSKLPGTYDLEFCKKGVMTKFAFDLSMPEIENYLSDDVRTQIYIHLMWCGYFLVFIIFGFLFFSILKKSDYLEKKEQSERLL